MLIEKANILFFSKIKCSQDKKSERKERKERSGYSALIEVAGISLTKNKSNLVLERFSLLSLFCLHCLLVPFFIFLSLFISSTTYAIEQASYESYAKKQEQKSKELIVPYITEINNILKNVSKNQSQQGMKKNKNKGSVEGAKKKCSCQKHKGQDGHTEEIAKNVKKSGFSKPSISSLGKSSKESIIIFASFSMPKESLKGWIRQAKIANASIYIRGLVNNSFKDTSLEVSKLVKDQTGGLLIDPSLFKKFSITQVPAVVVTKGDDFDVIYGDVSLGYALGKISNSRKEGKRDDLLRIIKKLRGVTKSA